MEERIMYIEYKGHDITGPGRIGLVSFSKSGRTLYYKGKVLKSLKGKDAKANYEDEKTGESYWISGCKKNGEDTLYAGKVDIDEDVREEYWTRIRNKPEFVNQKSYKTFGKYKK